MLPLWFIWSALCQMTSIIVEHAISYLLNIVIPNKMQFALSFLPINNLIHSLKKKKKNHLIFFPSLLAT